MRFFFPDSQDQVDPGFDFITEERDPYRVRQRDDLYAHEVFDPPPFDGLLVSKAIVDGYSDGSAGKYTAAQRLRLYREHARRFFRLDRSRGSLKIMGDCGAFSYINEDKPPYTVDEVVGFYHDCEFDYGISVDHVIFSPNPLATPVHQDDDQLRRWQERQDLTLTLASEFWNACKGHRVGFTPLGVAQGWSPESYADSVAQLQRIGYDRIALGGMVPYKTREIIGCLKAIEDVREPATELHLLGVSRHEDIPTFAQLGVRSFDSTSPFRQAFKDERNNYYTFGGAYVALRVPQVEGNLKLRKRIAAGEVDQRLALTRERQALQLLREYDSGHATLEETWQALQSYSLLWDTKDRGEAYRRTLNDRPWRDCDCALCRALGIDIAIFRGTERNKRRGFHNLYVFRQRLQAQLGEDPS
ncbi:tRNA-guanine transglycosylase DpdA [Micromonospora sp. NPDC048930]|uniref:tRNA-guanine transglycosylase DpdA n=1 Tax=Micromonospora sp. NPDC048930 TaxID=3364261 RepID=UPI0037219690